jgi:hypothetical protein
MLFWWILVIWMNYGEFNRIWVNYAELEPAELKHAVKLEPAKRKKNMAMATPRAMPSA